MKKEWIEPRLKDLKVNETQQDDVCLYEDEAKAAATFTLFPVIVWGDGKVGCTYWDCVKKGCTNPNYGTSGSCWPCPQATTTES